MSDGQSLSNPATVTLNIAAVNDAPQAADVQLNGQEDSAISGNLLGQASDIDGDALSALLVTPPQHGVLSLNADGSFNYVPNRNYNGSDSFSYRVNDRRADSNLATVSLTVGAVTMTCRYGPARRRPR